MPTLGSSGLGSRWRPERSDAGRRDFHGGVGTHGPSAHGPERSARPVTWLPGGSGSDRLRGWRAGCRHPDERSGLGVSCTTGRFCNFPSSKLPSQAGVHVINLPDSAGSDPSNFFPARHACWHFSDARSLRAQPVVPSVRAAPDFLSCSGARVPRAAPAVAFFASASVEVPHLVPALARSSFGQSGPPLGRSARAISSQGR